MKILHVIETLSPRYGGPVSVLKELACEQARIGHEVTIYTTNIDYPTGIMSVPINTTVIESGVNVEYYESQFKPLAVSIMLAKRINKTVRDFDIIHIHGLNRFPPTYAAKSAKKAGVPYIIRPFGSLSPYLFNRSAKSLFVKRVYWRFFDRSNIISASAIHFSSEAERDQTKYLNIGTDSFVIPNGINVKRFMNISKVGVFRSKLQLGNSKILMFVGRLNHVKGIDILVDAFLHIAVKHHDTYLIIVGPENDNYGEELKKRVSIAGLASKVLFIGMLHGEDLLSAYADADIFISPSRSESFGMTIVEAMACGTPVIVSRHVGIYKEIEKSGSGIVTDLQPVNIAEAIIKLLDNESMRRSMGLNARQAASALFSWEYIVPMLDNEYRKLISE